MYEVAAAAVELLYKVFASVAERTLKCRNYSKVTVLESKHGCIKCV